jgi:RNA polymerase sigma-70 factor (ECF subfamily)
MSLAATVATWSRSQVPSDEDVVRRVVAGEVALFEVLMRRNNQRLYRAVRSVLQSESEVEEVMQQSYVAAFGALSDFAHASKFSTWLVRIGLNAAFSHRRRTTEFIHSPSDEEDAVAFLPSPQPTPEDRASSRELSSLLENVLVGLPLMYRTVLMLREVEGLSTAETSEVLAVSEDAVKQRLHRAKGLAREALYARTEQGAGASFLFYAPRCDRVVAAVLVQLPDAARRA